MTTNGEWLFSKPFEEQYAWMNAEHQERALDGDTDALERKSADLIHEYYKPMVAELQAKVGRLTAERDEWKAKAEKLANDTLPDENGVSDPYGGSNVAYIAPDSREKLEAEASELVAEYAASGDVCDALYHGMLGLLDRQAAITEEKTRYKWVTASADEIAAWRSKAEKLKEQVYELTAERDKLQEQLRIGWECECRLQAERDKLKADLEAAYAKNRSLRQHISQMQNGRNEWHVKAVRLEKQLEVTNKRCEEYRRKFGKCLDYADAIHALMDDEGLA